MTAPVQTSPDPADLWDYLVSKGVSKADATRHVMLMLQHQPAEVRRQYLKDVDPGKLASFGLGAADMLSFGLGDQIARKVEGQEATDTQQAAKQEHPTARLLGQVAGVVTPLGAEMALEKAGIKLAPTALRLAARGVRSTAARAAAKTAVNAVEGALYAGAQAAGHTEGGVAPRAKAAAQAAPFGAAAGIALPWLAGAAGAAAKKVLGPVVERVAGKAPEPPVALLAGPSHTAGTALDDIGQAIADRQAGRISQEDLDVAMDFARRQMNQGAASPMLPSPKPPPDPLDVPTFMRRATPNPAIANPEGLLAPTPAAEPLLPSPLAQTPPEAAATTAARLLRTRAREAARTAYNLAISAGQTAGQAKAAAARAASAVGLLAP